MSGPRCRRPSGAPEPATSPTIIGRSHVMISIAQRIADELHVRVSQVDATIALLDDKSTVPFIARYRKEATGGLDDTQLRALAERLEYLRELEDRRATIANSIAEQGKMTPELAAAIAAADTKARLEDLYLPVQAETAHEGADRPRSRARTAGARAARKSAARARAGRSGLRRFGKGHRGHRRGSRGRTLDPDGDALGGCRARWRASSARLGAWRVAIDGRAGQGSRGRQVLRLLRRQRAGEERAVAPRTRAVARAQGRDPAPHRRAAGRRGCGRSHRAGAPHCRKGRHCPEGPAGRRLARRDRPLDVEGPDARAPRSRDRAAAARAGRGRGHSRLRPQPARPAPGRTRGTAHDARPGPGAAHGREGGRRRRHRQGARHRDGVSARAAQGLGGNTPRPRGSLRAARCAARLDWQRHGLPRDRRARRRSDQAPSGTRAHEGHGLRGRRIGVLRVGAGVEGAARSRCLAARRRLDRAAAAGSARRARAHRTEGDRRRSIPARPQPGPARAAARRRRRGLRQRGRRRSRIPRRPRSSRGSPASTNPSRRTSSRSATSTARSGTGASC